MSKLFIIEPNGSATAVIADGRRFSFAGEIAAGAQSLADSLAGEAYSCPRFEIEPTPEGAIFRAAVPPTRCYAWDVRDNAAMLSLIEAIEAAIASKLAEPPPDPPPPSDWDIWNQKQAEGYQDPPVPDGTGFKLLTTEEAQTQFAKMTTLVMLAMQAGAITSETPQGIWDSNNEVRIITTGEFLALMLRYGFFCKGIHDQFKP